MQKFFDKLLNVLRHDERFFSRDGNFLRNKVREAAVSMDERLLTLLLSDDELSKRFFVDAAGVKVFNGFLFSDVVSNQELLPDSFTRFKNKIALGFNNGDFLSASGCVVVDFPYKDCVLEGDQTDAHKRDELFYSATLATDDVDRLLNPKVLVNAVRYSNDAAQVANDFKPDDNLIIKGNNLLALASLEKVFRAQVKLIYIDPPYNTGNDSFGYNDRFNHATWLTFMKNRLDLARKLLKPDGSIWISIDDDEQAYLKVLADEIFGRDNFVCNVVWEKKYSPQNDATWLSDSHDFILVYAKDKIRWRPNLLPRTEEMNARYSNPDNDPRGAWMPSDLTSKTQAAGHSYCIESPTGKKFYPTPGRQWAPAYETFLQWSKENRIWFGTSGNRAPMLKKFLSEVKQGLVCTTIWKRNDVGDNMEAKREILALNVDFETPKPERLLERILTLATGAGDLVLDYHLGSGTTAAVAHKMGRRYIGVEQMDYVETVTAARLRKVIAGEQGGISERVGWTGGGSFVYCELAKQNQTFVDELEAARDFEAIADICGRMIATGFISHKVDPAQIDKHWSDFEALTLAEQKRFLMMLLDMNLLYVNLCDLEDTEFGIDDAAKSFTRSFYRS